MDANLRQALQALATERNGWRAPRPGSNFLPMLCLETAGGDVDGEDMDALQRLGFLAAYPAGPHAKPFVQEGGMTELFGEIPDIDLDHVWKLTPKALAAIGQAE